jgi:hypothetical protein
MRFPRTAAKALKSAVRGVPEIPAATPATRAMLRFIFTFGAGVYTGIYVTQNYEVPLVDSPRDIVEKTQKLLEDLLSKSGKH